MTRLVGPFSQLLPLAHEPLRGPISDDQLEIIPNGGLLMEGDVIIGLGTFDDLLQRNPDEIVEFESDGVALPGFVDSHTHICFAGSRARDFAMRNAGKTYLEIAQEGGGIWDTVQATRKAPVEELIKGIRARAERHLSEGVTTIEVKSGYGLHPDSELRMLDAIFEANQLTPVDLVPTCLAAHILPTDFDGDSATYLDWIYKELLPIVWKKSLARRVDIFLEATAFSEPVAIPYLLACKSMGFEVTIHADQFSSGGTHVALEVDAVSADHLEALSSDDLDRLAKSHTVATALPGASIGLGVEFPPCRKLLDAGAILAIASDWNPGSAPMGNLLTQASILASYEKLSTAEVFSALTYRAAHALRLNDRGRLAPRRLADFIVFPTSDYREILYHQGNIRPAQVWKNGERTGI